MLSIILLLIVVGVLLYIVHAVIPMDPKIRVILDVVVILGVCLWIAQATGLMAVLDRPVRFGR